MKLRSGIETRVWACGCGECARGICLRVQSPFRMHRCVYRAHARVCACMVARRARAARARGARQEHRRHEGEGAPRVARQQHAAGSPVRPAARRRPSPRCRACAAAPRARPHRAAASPVVGRGRHRARTAGARGRPARVGGGPEPLGAAARLARRRASVTELAALPAAVVWPKLKTL
jgi:hypothetical protein